MGAVCRVADAIGASGDRIEEFEINPLLVYPEGEGVLAVDLMIRTAPYGEQPGGRPTYSAAAILRPL